MITNPVAEQAKWIIRREDKKGAIRRYRFNRFANIDLGQSPRTRGGVGVAILLFHHLLFGNLVFFVIVYHVILPFPMIGTLFVDHIDPQTGGDRTGSRSPDGGIFGLVPG